MVRSQSTHQCLEAETSSNSNRVLVSDCDDNNFNQYFRVGAFTSGYPNKDSGYYQIKPMMASRQCLNIEQESKEDYFKNNSIWLYIYG